MRITTLRSARRWKFRYPGEMDEPDRAEAEAALAIARRVYQAILERVNPPGH